MIPERLPVLSSITITESLLGPEHVVIMLGEAVGLVADLL
jgi:hypothetical protein